MTYSVRNIVIAVVLAVFAAVLVIMYTSNAQNSANKGQQSMQVLVAKTEIAPGTDVADAITAGAFQTRSVVAKDVVPGALNSVNTLPKDYASTGMIAAGSQITAGMFAKSAQNPIVTQISGVERAVQFALNSNMVLGGTLRAGDHVDIIWDATVHPTGNDSKYGDAEVAKPILIDVPVLSTYDTGVASPALTADGQPADSGGSSDGTSGLSVIVKVPQTQVATLLLALKAGNVWFALRPPDGTGKDAAKDSPIILTTVCSALAAGMTPAQIKRQIPSCIGGN